MMWERQRKKTGTPRVDHEKKRKKSEQAQIQVAFKDISHLSHIMPQHHVHTPMTKSLAHTLRSRPVIVFPFQTALRWWECPTSCILEIQGLRVLAAQIMHIKMLRNARKHQRIRVAALAHC